MKAGHSQLRTSLPDRIAAVTKGDSAKRAVKRGVLRGGSAAIRGFGMVTAGTRPDPDFLLIGAKRGGSTSFYYDLITHPQVALLFPRPDRLPKATATKGIHYFDSNYFRGSRWYRSHLPSRRVRRAQEQRAGGQVLVGEGSPYYLTHPFAPDRVLADLPDVKLLAVLRDPVLRTYSHWKERVREGREDLPFVEALAAEPTRVGDAASRLGNPRFYSYAHEQQGYLEQSRYGASLARWRARFPESAFHLVRSEDYYVDQTGVLDDAARFLGIEPGQFDVGAPKNAAAGESLDESTYGMVADLLREDARDLRDLTGLTWDWV